MTIREAYSILTSLRSVFDVARIVDPEERKIWDIDEEGNFEPVQTCYEV